MCLFFNAAGKRVLVWTQSVDIILGLTEIENVFAAEGIDINSWTGNLDDYQLICFPAALSDPPWWSSISSGTWEGRLFITADHDGSGGGSGDFTASAAYVNSKSGLSGIGVVGASLAGGSGFAGPTEPDDLTDGVSSIWHSGASYVSGGTTLARLRPVDGSQPLVARNQSGTIDWVVAGDSNILYDRLSFTDSWGAGINSAFFRNLYEVAV